MFNEKITKRETQAMTLKSIETYKDLLSALSSMTAAQLKQPVQIADPKNDGRPVELHCGIALGTVGEFQFEGSRSVADNKYHADEVVLLIDANPFADDGALAYRLESAGPKGKQIMRHVPQYGRGGRTKREDQLAPVKLVKKGSLPSYVGAQCVRRVKSMKDVKVIKRSAEA